MKSSVKKFFLLGLGIAAAGIAAGFAIKHKDKIKKAAMELSEKGKIAKKDAMVLAKELVTELEKLEKKAVSKAKKVARNL